MLYFINTPVSSGTGCLVTFDDDVDQAYVALAGFDVDYSDGDDHCLQTLRATISDVSLSGNALTFDNTTTIEDASGHSGAGTIYALVIGASPDDPTLFAPLDTWYTTDGSCSYQASGQAHPLDRATVLITGFVVSYGDTDHDVGKLKICTGNEQLVATSTQEDDGSHTWVITYSPALVLHDASGNSLDTSSSYLELLLIASPLIS